MTFGLTPGKLGFKLGEVLVGLQSGTTDTPETIASSSNKLHTIGYAWDADTLSWIPPLGTSSGSLVNITDGAGVVNTKQLGTSLTTTDVGLVTNTVIHGVTTGGGGGYVDVKVTPSGALTVETTPTESTVEMGRVGFSMDAVSPFGDLITAPITPLIQMDWIYGINTQTGVSTTANGGAADTSNGRLRLQTGTNTAGSAIFRSRRPARYRPGQGIIARFTPVFTTGVASSTQLMGPGTDTDGYFFGYNGTALGILHRSPYNSPTDTWIPQSSWNGDKCSRKWHEPFIRVDVTTVGIGVTMTLEDFVQALGAEAGVDLQAAAERVVAGMKRETSKAM